MIKEIDEVTPVLKIISAYKREQKSHVSILRSSRTSQFTCPAVHMKELEIAAREFYMWLKLPDTPARTLLAIMSSDGVFYAAHAMHRASRAYIECGPGREYDGFVAAVRAPAVSLPAPTGETDENNVANANLGLGLVS